MTSEEYSEPLRDEIDVNADSNCNRGSLNESIAKDDGTVSSAPPRLQIEPLTDPPTNIANSDTSNLAVDASNRSDLSTPTTLANKKFVTFFNSEEDGTPIASSDFVDDNRGDVSAANSRNANENSMARVSQPLLEEKKEETANEVNTESEDVRLTPVETTSRWMEPQQHGSRSTPVSHGNDDRESTRNQSSVSVSQTNVNIHQSNNNNKSPSRIAYTSPPGRRSITLTLLEEVPTTTNNTSPYVLTTPFKKLNLRRFRSLSLSTVRIPEESKLDNMTDRSQNSSHSEETKYTNHGDKNTDDGDHSSIRLVNRGIISVSWYEGTTSSEMTQHVYNCVLRKLKTGSNDNSGEGKKKLEDVRLLDETVVPCQEVVLCPFLPDGSHFLLKFKTTTPQTSQPKQQQLPFNPYHAPYISQAPDSPSAEPSPFPSSSNLNGLSATAAASTSQNGANMNAQLQLLNAATVLLQSGGIKTRDGFSFGLQQHHSNQQQHPLLPKLPMLPNIETVPKEFKEHTPPTLTARSTGGNEETSSSKLSPNNSEDMTKSSPHNDHALTTDELIEQQLRQLNELFLLRNESHQSSTTSPTTSTNTNNPTQTTNPHDPHLLSYYKSQEKKQVIFTIANYLLLFMSLIAISAEIQSRLPQWMTWVQSNYDSVQNCASDHTALFECISNGNFSGLVASFVLWATQSASAKRIFLFGFESPKKLWTVVYEAGVTAVCWGLSYIFIRRGLNPNTREKFLQKYWKDAVYGSLAGFNAAFMKAVLKNLVPQDVALQAIETRQLRIFNWLGMLMSEE